MLFLTRQLCSLRRYFSVRVRYAPSPTGKMHLGGLRTAEYNDIFAEQKGGTFVLRIQDTDRKRLVQGSVQDIMQTLDWAGIRPKEGPGTKEQPYGPYVQSERLHIYKRYLDEMRQRDMVYPCFCTPERLEKLAAQQKNSKQTMKYDGHCRHIPQAEAQKRVNQGEKHVIRFKSPVKDITFRDLTYGQVSFSSDTIDDFILIKTDGWPTYHFANVVDDVQMKISHVIRGQQWITSTPKHILLYEAFSKPLPIFVHLPLILSPKGGKLSKRDNSTSIEYYKQAGFEPEAILSAIALIGWAPEKEMKDVPFMSREELVRQFNIDRIHKAPGMLDVAKLQAINKRCMREKYFAEGQGSQENVRALTQKLGDKAKQFNDQQIKLISQIALDRSSTWKELFDQFDYLFNKPNYSSPQSLKDFKKLFKISSQVKLKDNKPTIPSSQSSTENLKILGILKSCISSTPFTDPTTVHNTLQSMIKSQQRSQKEVYHLLRYCLTGRSSGPGIQKVLLILGKPQVLSRLSNFA